MPGDRILFPESGFTKSDAVDDYRRVAKVLLPHLRNRPVSFKRLPDTIQGQSFWEKDAPSFTAKWVKRVAVPRRSGESDIDDERHTTRRRKLSAASVRSLVHRPHPRR